MSVRTLHHGKNPIFFSIWIINTYILQIFPKILVIFSSPPLYINFIRPPKVGDPIPEYILNNPHSLSTLLEPLMAPISMHLLPPIKMTCTIEMVPSQPMPWPFATFPYVFSIPRVAGKGLLLMHRCFTIPTSPISAYLMGNTSSQTQISPCALPYLFHIMVQDITFPNGVMLS